MRSRAVLAAAIAVGLGIAYVDSQPSWDDTGITAAAMVLAAGGFAFIAPRRPWLLALAIGIWIPINAILHQHSPGSLMMLTVLAFPLAGAYAGCRLSASS